MAKKARKTTKRSKKSKVKSKKRSKPKARKSSKKKAKKAVKKSRKAKKTKVKKAKSRPVKVSQSSAAPLTDKPVKPTGKFNKKDLDYYKKGLMELRRKVTTDITQLEEGAFMNTRDASGEISGYTFHMADVATDAYDQELNLGLASSEQSLLNRIDDALKRIEDGIYGFSVKSGKPIGKKRLNVVPYAELTIQEQEEEEKQRKLRG